MPMLFAARWTRRFSLQLAMLLGEGVSLYEALELIRLQQKGRAGTCILQSVKSELRSGRRLLQALMLHPRHFKPHFIKTIERAEAAGSPERLSIVLRLLADDITPRTSPVAPVFDPITGHAWRDRPAPLEPDPI